MPRVILISHLVSNYVLHLGLEVDEYPFITPSIHTDRESGWAAESRAVGMYQAAPIRLRATRSHNMGPGSVLRRRIVKPGILTHLLAVLRKYLKQSCST
jgi:hypothetical protein